MRYVTTVTFGVALLVLTSAFAADEFQWSQFRGPASGAVADDQDLPDTWSETENVV